jgi:uracil phosphoribosyltransferase
MFKHYTDRLAGIVVERAISTLPAEDIIVTTPHGKKYKGLALEDKHELLGVLITQDGRLLEPALKGALPTLQVASVWTSRGADGSKQVDKHSLPADVATRRVSAALIGTTYYSASQLCAGALAGASVGARTHSASSLGLFDCTGRAC